ncbi:MAG: hypothetical protein F6K42_15555 [Leptolyngbya sp. SIO1D8]|nr:hypothetical protein [Leptolyngbya sp. SIO1D8]
MSTFAQKQKPMQKAKSASPKRLNRAFFGKSREVNTIPNLQRTIGNQAAQRSLLSDEEAKKKNSLTSEPFRFFHDFSRIPVRAVKPNTSRAQETAANWLNNQPEHSHQSIMYSAQVEMGSNLATSDAASLSSRAVGLKPNGNTVWQNSVAHPALQSTSVAARYFEPSSSIHAPNQFDGSLPSLSTPANPANRRYNTPTIYQNPQETQPSVSPPTTPLKKRKPPLKVKKFGMKFGKWNTSWPGYIQQTATIRLPVNFELELAEGSSKEDCVIGQEKKGLVTYGKTVEWFPIWKSDSGFGWRDWWDGKKWNVAWGSWGSLWGTREASFADEPGFNKVHKNEFPIYWGGTGRKGYFKFRTYVKEGHTLGRTVKELNWGMLIDYSAADPQKGVHYFYT